MAKSAEAFSLGASIFCETLLYYLFVRVPAHHFKTAPVVVTLM